MLPGTFQVPGIVRYQEKQLPAIIVLQVSINPLARERLSLLLEEKVSPKGTDEVAMLRIRRKYR